ncbi:MAG: HAD-IA family hydrolase [Planctomycetota bacterium]
MSRLRNPQSPVEQKVSESGENSLDFDWIVFDSTGTLMAPKPEAASVYLSIGAQFGLDLSLDSVRSSLRQSIRNHFFGDRIEQPTDESLEDIRWRRIVSDVLPGLDGDRFEDAFHTLWHQFADASSWELFDDVHEVLGRLRQRGYRIAAASNFDRRLRGIARDLGLAEKLDEILISSELRFSKPNTKFYDRATERLGARDRSRLLMIGDTFRGDVEAARAAGWKARHLIRDQEDALLTLTADL